MFESSLLQKYSIGTEGSKIKRRRRKFFEISPNFRVLEISTARSSANLTHRNPSEFIRDGCGEGIEISNRPLRFPLSDRSRGRRWVTNLQFCQPVEQLRSTSRNTHRVAGWVCSLIMKSIANLCFKLTNVFEWQLTMVFLMCNVFDDCAVNCKYLLGLKKYF